jgi:hypothetical protein
MKLSEIMRAFGAELADFSQNDAGMVLLLRVPEPLMRQWQGGVEALLSAELPAGLFLDISRAYMRHGGQIVFFWRLVLSGDPQQGLRLLLREARKGRSKTAPASPVELTSFPRVGGGTLNNPTGNGIAGVYTATGFMHVVSTNKMDL